jgi:hypothetical protein
LRNAVVSGCGARALAADPRTSLLAAATRVAAARPRGAKLIVVPFARIIADANGNLLGTTEEGGIVVPGTGGAGTVFEIAKTAGGYASTPKILSVSARLPIALMAKARWPA